MEPQPTPTELEQEQGPERLREEEDMRGSTKSDDPQLPVEDDGDE